MFSSIAGRYDLMNTLMTGGMDRFWRQAVVRQCALQDGDQVLDLGTGTGELALALARQSHRHTVWASDISWDMLAQARAKPACRTIRFAQADALHLPFPTGMFDAVVSGFLMRNLPDHRQALQEQIRVLKPGGRLVFLDILAPRYTYQRQLFSLFFFQLVPWLGWLVTGSRTAYRYLPESTLAYPSPFALLHLMQEQGLQDYAFTTCMGNAISIHVGTKTGVQPAGAA